MTMSASALLSFTGGTVVTAQGVASIVVGVLVGVVIVGVLRVAAREHVLPAAVALYDTYRDNQHSDFIKTIDAIITIPALAVWGYTALIVWGVTAHTSATPIWVDAAFGAMLGYIIVSTLDIESTSRSAVAMYAGGGVVAPLLNLPVLLLGTAIVGPGVVAVFVARPVAAMTSGVAQAAVLGSALVVSVLWSYAALRILKRRVSRRARTIIHDQSASA